MIGIAKSIIEEAKKEAAAMLLTGEITRPLRVTAAEKNQSGPTAIAVSTKGDCLIGGFPFEVDGKKFFVGIHKTTRT